MTSKIFPDFITSSISIAIKTYFDVIYFFSKSNILTYFDVIYFFSKSNVLILLCRQSDMNRYL